MKRLAILLLVLTAMTVVCLSACGGEGAMTTEETTTAPVTTLSPENLETLDNQAYLDTVSYLDFELTGETAPYYVGRWFEKQIDGVMHMVTVNDGSQLYMMVDGATSLNVNFTAIHAKETPYYSYSIDGATPKRKLITDPTVELPDTNKHTVRIMTDGLTESENKWSGEIGFALKSVEVSEGGKLYGIKPRNKVIFFYGDSITEGIASLSAKYNSNGNSATRAYSWYTASELGAVPYVIGYGGSGLAQAGSFQPMLRAIDYLSAKRKVDSSSYAAVTPDLIVINHGYNDASHGVSATQFEALAREAITRLQAKYPDVTIVYVVPFAEKSKTAIAEYGEKLDGLSAELDGFYVVHTDTWTLRFTDGVHLSTQGAMIAGEKIAEAILAIVGEDFFR